MVHKWRKGVKNVQKNVHMVYDPNHSISRCYCKVLWHGPYSPSIIQVCWRGILCNFFSLLKFQRSSYKKQTLAWVLELTIIIAAMLCDNFGDRYIMLIKSLLWLHCLGLKVLVNWKSLVIFHWNGLYKE